VDEVEEQGGRVKCGCVYDCGWVLAIDVALMSTCRPSHLIAHLTVTHLSPGHHHILVGPVYHLHYLLRIVYSSTRPAALPMAPNLRLAQSRCCVLEGFNAHLVNRSTRQHDPIPPMQTSNM
jgi:hypothetical protein